MKCHFCNAIFDQESSRGDMRAFCSQACTQKFYELRRVVLEHEKKMVTKLCKCGKEFVTYNDKQKFCSKECLNQFDRHYYCRLKRRNGEDFSYGVDIKQHEMLKQKIVLPVRPESKRIDTCKISDECLFSTEPLGGATVEEMMLLVAKKNENFDLAFDRMLKLPYDKLRIEFEKLSNSDKKAYLAFCKSKYQIKASRMIVSRTQNNDSGNKNFRQRVMDAVKGGYLGYFSSSTISKREVALGE